MPNYRRARIPGGTYFFTLVSYQRQKILCSDDIRIALRDAITHVRTKLPFTIDAMVLMPDHLHAVWTLPADDGDYSTRWSIIKRLVTQRVGAGQSSHGAPYGFDVGVGGAHGAPYGDDADRKIYGGKPRFVGCAMRTDIIMGRDDDYVGCAVRTEELSNNVSHHNGNTRTDEFSNHGASNGDGGNNGVCKYGGRVRRAHHNPNTPMLTTASRLKRREGNIWQRRFWEHEVRDQEDLNRCIDYLHWNPVKHGYANKVADWPYSTFHRYVHEGIYPMDWGGQGVDDGSGFGE